MKITVESPARSVAIQVKGDTIEHMREAESIVARLLADAPPAPARPPIGFAAPVEDQVDDCAA